MKTPRQRPLTLVLRPQAGGGFTLVEMLVSLLIVSAMLSVVFYLFGSVQGTTRTSLAKAQLSLVGKNIDTRLRLDAKSMLGPNSKLGSAAGCLVIVPALREGYLPLPGGQMGRHKVRLRSDQLVFFSDTSVGSWLSGGSPIARPWSSVLAPDQNDPGLAVQSNQARIWIGAVQDGNLTPGDKTNQDPTMLAHRWMVGRQAKLIGRLKADGTADPAFATTNGSLTMNTATDPSVVAIDYTTGSLGLLADGACGVQLLPGGTSVRGLRNSALGRQSRTDWLDDKYVTDFANKPNVWANYTNLPTVTPEVDLSKYRQDPAASWAAGIQFLDLQKAHTRFLENCSEFVAQWAGDLDKDGQIDFYPPNHPLAGSIIWYPEEYHATAGKNAVANQFPAAMQAKYAQITTNPWTGAFPSGFAPAVKHRFGGNGNAASHPYPSGFEFDYGETSNLTGGPATSAPRLPQPYVFRFSDDQFRLVRYGFRQDGSSYFNQAQGRPFGALGYTHAFPYPPQPHPYPATAPGTTDNPDVAVLYAAMPAPSGPYPKTPAVAVTNRGNANFADNMVAGWVTPPADQQPFGAGPFRTKPSETWPKGQLLHLDPGWKPQRVYRVGPSPRGNFVMLAVAVTGTAATGSETILAPSVAYRSEPTGRFPRGQRISIVPSDEPGYAKGTVAGGNFTNAARGWFSIKLLNASAVGNEPQINVMGASYMSLLWGPNNNYIASYRDVWEEYLKPINTPGLQGTTADWRNPQSDWPRLLRLRFRLHDREGLVTSYSDEALINGRDNDGDGRVNNPEEGTMSGIWFEYILAVPYPIDPAPRGH